MTALAVYLIVAVFVAGLAVFAAQIVRETLR